MDTCSITDEPTLDDISSDPLATTFQPTDCTQSPPSCPLPDDAQWRTLLETHCTFSPSIFCDVMLNLIRNPNVTSSHLFRADIFYDSERDPTNTLLPHLKREYQPRGRNDCFDGFERTRTVVRQLVPRNPQLDRPLVQTCIFFRRSCSDDKKIGESDDDDEITLTVYLPHVDSAEEMPFYHPAVSRVAFLHGWRTSPISPKGIGRISISYRFFPPAPSPPSSKLTRTALRLLQTIYKHGQGRLVGYQKRVHLDRLLPQKRYQDTYARLKRQYGKSLAEQWVEVTDPGKHVFEDLAIAAYLIELWREMYRCDDVDDEGNGDKKVLFPGFVDIGCGNGVLVYLLLSEGYEGWGMDARARKTWKIFPPEVQKKLQRRVLIPPVLSCPPTALNDTSPIRNAKFDGQEEIGEAKEEIWHPGFFPRGTFLISNHADELTTWTPLLAYLSSSGFLAIPCCSHDFSGARFRAPLHIVAPGSGDGRKVPRKILARLPQQQEEGGESQSLSLQAAETGSLRRLPIREIDTPQKQQPKQPSAYASLCTYVSQLAGAVGYLAEEDVLRIPSTRNQAIVGRKWRRHHGHEALHEGNNHQEHENDSFPVSCLYGEVEGDEEFGTKLLRVSELVEREMGGQSVHEIGAAWMARAEKLVKKPGSGH